MDKKLLHVLIIDDSPDDAELVVEALRHAGYLPKSQRIQDVSGLHTALGRESWDVVIAETDVPHLAVPAILDALRHTQHTPPCILMTRTISAADMAELMAAGARDIVFKNQASRLAPVIERELAVFRDRDALNETRQMLAEMQERYQALVDGSHDAICYSQDGMHTSANRAYLGLFGYNDVKELEEIPVLNLIDRSQHVRLKEQFRKAARTPDGVRVDELTAIRKDGSQFPAEITISAIRMDGESWHQIRVTDVSRQKHIEDRLQFLHDHDPLTGLYNRDYFLKALGDAVTTAKGGGRTAVALHLDLVQLREINDRHGYAVGDRLIVQLAEHLRAKLRDGDILARLGPDEFAVLLPDYTERPGADAAATISGEFEEISMAHDGKPLTCRCAAGVAVIDASINGVEQVLALAYQARAAELQSAAEAPPVVVEAVPDRPSATVHRIDRGTPIPKAIENALRNDGLRLLYQPIVNLHGNPSENYEVLVRLATGSTELMTAGEFMPTAEQAGLSGDIDRQVVRRALESLRNLRTAHRRATLFVNLSRAAVLDVELPIIILEALRETGVKGGSLVFEINEMVLAEETQKSLGFMAALRKLGCRFAADDFGRRLGKPPLPQSLDYLKIDNTLVHALIEKVGGAAVVQQLIEDAGKENRRVIIKNVEDAASLAVLWNYGIEYVQGNYFQLPDMDLNYNFAGESIDSDQATAGWTRPER